MRKDDYKVALPALADDSETGAYPYILKLLPPELKLLVGRPLRPAGKKRSNPDTAETLTNMIEICSHEQLLQSDQQRQSGLYGQYGSAIFMNSDNYHESATSRRNQQKTTRFREPVTRRAAESGSERSSRPERALDDIKCYICEGKHYARSCLNKVLGACHNCNRPGHFFRDCLIALKAHLARRGRS